MDENLRFGPDYKKPMVATTLHFAEDLGDFGQTSERCIGMGKCRAQQGAMCPSYQATQQERYSTRGRAHLLHELVRGEVIRDGWQDESIHDSLEHCLSCKACKGECPTKVDIASYKAEFMSQHYAKKRRPVGSYLLGMLGSILPVMSRLSAIVNPLQASPLGVVAKKVLGFSSDVKLPMLASQSFTAWVKIQNPTADDHFWWFGDPTAMPVYLWADSFNSHYRPHLLQSAITVLNTVGFKVGVARQKFCCGRTLYEQGMLDQARVDLTQILDGFYPLLENASPVIVLEASCLSVFHDELLRMFASDARANDLSTRCMTLAAFLIQNDIKPARKLKSGLLQLHCHHKALESTASDREWMQYCFESVSEPEEGCCGMAGSYGLKEKTRHIGNILFERNLGPAINSSSDETVIVTNGFSCHEQITQKTGAKVLHPVEVTERCIQD